MKTPANRGASQQSLLPGLDRTPKMKNHPVPTIVPAREAGHWYGERHDSIVNRFKLTDAIKHWNESPDATGFFSYERTQKNRYGRLTAQIYDGLGLTKEQREVAREQRNYRDFTEATVLAMVRQAEFMLARLLFAAVDSRRSTHEQIHNAFTKRLKQIAPPMVLIIQLAKEMN